MLWSLPQAAFAQVCYSIEEARTGKLIMTSGMASNELAGLLKILEVIDGAASEERPQPEVDLYDETRSEPQTPSINRYAEQIATAMLKYLAGSGISAFRSDGDP